MKLLLFGGTFDPPHMGHISILQNAIEAVQPDTVVVMPANVPPHKRQSTTPFALRLAMCACFLPLFDGLIVSDLEMQRVGKSYTLDTICRLKALYPTADIYVCIGSDMLLSFTTWHQYEEVLRKAVLVVQCRRHEDVSMAYAAADILRGQGAKVLFASGEVEEMSSTQLRAELAAGRSAKGQIPPPADEIVRQMGLYRPKEGGVPS